jgi:Cu+-exporting ATPase
MTLEPAVPATDTGPNLELVEMRRRFWVGLPLALVVLVLAMGHHVRALSAIADAPWSAWVQFALASPVVLWCGWPFLMRGVKSVSRRSLNMFTLIALGVGAAYLYSVAAVLVPQAFPADLRDMHGQIGVYFEAAAVIIVLVLLGQVLELQARERTGGAIRALLKLAPKIAHRVATMVRRATFRSKPPESVTACACAQGSACRLMESSRAAQAASMNRCLRANRCRSRRL